MIKYGISRNYLPDWGIQEALREVFQNFLDYGEYNLNTYKEDNFVHVYLDNDYSPAHLGFLAIGESEKRNDSSTIGKHGEGLKMALMVLTRCVCHPKIIINYKNEFDGYFYNDAYLGECFSLIKSETTTPPRNSFEIRFKVPKEDWENFHVRTIKEDEVIYHDSYHGDLIDKPAGDIYVGGLYVCNLPEIKYAYNFNPGRIELDRDRKVPRSYDVEYHASQILAGSGKLKKEDLFSRDTNYIHTVPSNVAKQFKPKLTKDKRITFEDNKGNRTPERVTTALLNDPLQKKRVAKLQYTVSRKRTPENMLKEFYSIHKYQFNAKMQIEFNVLIKKAKDWK